MIFRANSANSDGLIERNLVIRGAAQTHKIRKEMFMGEEHIVVPIVALVANNVIHASNSKTPEFVPADSVASTANAWSGEPVFGDHPTNLDGEKVAGNSPEILQRLSFGRLFNSEFDGTRLLVEAWLNPARAEQVGPDAEAVIKRANDGQPIEVSVGAFVRVADKAGVHNGKPYKGIWSEIIPDHLAMLPEGTIGACSNEMGCGLRKAMLMTADGYQFEGMEDLMDKEEQKALEGKVSMIVAAVAKLLGLNKPEETIAEEDVCQCGGTCEPCKLAAASEGVDKTTELSVKSETSAKSAEGKETVDPKTIARIAALIAHAGSPFSEAHAEFLAGFPVEELGVLETAAETAVPTVAEEKPKPVIEPIDAEEKTLSVDEWLSATNAPDSVKGIVTGHLAAAVARKENLVKVLSEKQSTYTLEQLTAKPTDELEQLISFLKAATPAVDFSLLAEPDLTNSKTAPAVMSMAARFNKS